MRRSFPFPSRRSGKEMEAYEKEQHEARALEGMLRKLEKENMRWEQKTRVPRRIDAVRCRLERNR